MEGFARGGDWHAWEGPLDEVAEGADVQPALEWHIDGHDLLFVYLETLGFQQLPVLIRREVAPGFRLLGFHRLQVVLSPEDSEGLHHPPTVEVLALGRMRTAEEGAIEGEDATRAEGFPDLLKQASLVRNIVNRVAVDNGVHTVVDFLADGAGIPLDELNHCITPIAKL